MFEKYREVLSRAGMKEKLRKAYEKCRQEKPIRIILGNPSCDQDSFIGSHVLAVVEGRIPVVNLKRKIFNCKKDLVEIIEMLGVSCDDLVFLEEENKVWYLIRGSEKISIKENEICAGIVDHNLPCKDFLACETFLVDQVIDHHPILEMNEMYSKVRTMCIELNAGSCSSLIYRDIKGKIKEELKNKPEEYSFLLLLTIPILTDTGCLTDRTHEVDREGVKDLLKLTGISMKEATEMYKHLKKRKKCESEIECDLILQMDYKVFEYPPKGKGKIFGISSVKYPYDEWIKRDGKEKFAKTVESFVKEENLEFFLINCKSKGVREFFVYSAPGKDFISKVIFNGKEPSQREVEGSPDIIVYKADTSLSRKIIAPKIYTYLDSIL